MRWSEIKLVIPEWYNYIFISQGRPLDVREESTNRRTFNVPMNISRRGVIDVETNLTRLAMKNVPALKEETFITTMDDYYARIRFQLSSIKYPGGTEQQILSTWDKLAMELEKNDNFGLQYSRKRNYDLVYAAIAPVFPINGTVQERVEAVYQFLLSNIEVKRGNSIFTQGKLNDCFEKKSARAGEMNLLMIALLREFNIPAHPLLISTRTHGKPMPLYPLVDQFNHVMALVEMGDEYIIVDASHPLRQIGFPAYNSLNGQGWAMIKGNPKWIDIPTPSGNETLFPQYVAVFGRPRQGRLFQELQWLQCFPRTKASLRKPFWQIPARFNVQCFS